MKKNINIFLKKVLIIFCIFSLIIPTYSNAGLNETLINPVKDLLLLIADGALGIMQGFTMGDYNVTLPSDTAEESGWVATKLAKGINNLTGLLDDKIDELSDIANIRYTPYQIFTNKIATFDANFFNKNDTSQNITNFNGGTVSAETSTKAFESLDRLSKGEYTDVDVLYEDMKTLETFAGETLPSEKKGKVSNMFAYSYQLINDYKKAHDDPSISSSYSNVSLSEFAENFKDDSFVLTYNSITNNLTNSSSGMTFEYLSDNYEEAFADYRSNGAYMIQPSVLISTIKADLNTNGSTRKIYSTAYTLAPTISKWYSSLTVIAIVSMMSVLVYSGIRIIISSASKDKAKYKQMIVDWFVALCLLFFMRYIMSFSFAFVDKIISLLSNINSGSTTFFNQTRNIAGMQSNGWLALGYTIIYIVLVCITVYFTFVYLKRVLYLAFLTMISPLVAFTYPIDKISDGKAQAFNMWLKEYLFNLLIQPLHLVLYSVLIGTASDLVDSNYIYAVVALGFMTQAEKLLRKFFGFEKAQTPGFLNGPAGGALMMEGFKKLTGWGPGSHNKSKGASDSSSSGAGKDKVNIPQRSVDSYRLMSENSDNNDSTINIPMESESPSDNYNIPLSGQNDVDLIDDYSSFGSNASQPYSYNFDNNDSTVNIPLGLESSSNEYSIPLSGQDDVDLIDDYSSFGFGQNDINDTPSNPTSSDSTSNPNRFKRAMDRINGSKFGRAFDATTSAYGRGLKRKIKNYASNEFLNPSKNLASVGKVFKSAAKMAAGIGTGAIGLCIGIATGDPKQALQDTIIGAQAGSRLTGNIADKIGNTLHVDGLDTTFERAYYGDDYNEHLEKEEYQKWIDQNEEQLIRTLGKDKFEKLRKNETLEKYKEDGMTDKQIKDNLGEEKYKELKERELLKEYFSAGIDNVEEIIACEKFKDAHTNFDTDSAIGVMKIANDMHDKDLPKKKEILFENFKDKNPEKSKDDIDKLVANQLSFNKEIEKYKKKAI